jgi:hypothetical protein
MAAMGGNTVSGTLVSASFQVGGLAGLGAQGRVFAVSTFGPLSSDPTEIATITVAGPSSVSLDFALVSVTPADPVITWPTPSPITYGTALTTNQLNATASVPGTFTYSPPLGTVPDAGSTNLSASFSPSDPYHVNAVTSSVPLLILPAALSVTASNAIRFYGQANPAFTGYIEGVVNGDDISAVYSTPATVVSPPGSYPIIPSLVDPGGRLRNYLAVTNDGTLTILPASTLTGHVYCTCDSNVLAGSFVQVGAFSTSTGSDGSYALTGVPPGTYPVTVSRVNYGTFTNIVFVPSDLSAVVADYYLSAETLIIDPIFDTSILQDASAGTITNSIKAAIQVYELNFSDPVCVKILFAKTNTGLGMSSSFGSPIAYSDYVAALNSHASSANDRLAVAVLPSGAANPVNGSGFVRVNTANQRALGFTVVPPSGQPDSTIFLNVLFMNLDRGAIDPKKYDLMAVVSHEIDEALGFGSALNGLTNGAPAPTGPIMPEDLFRYDQQGARSLTADATASSYFSVDGSNRLARFNQSDGGVHADFGDWYSPGGQRPQVQDAFNTAGSAPNLGVEQTVLDVIGYTPATPISSPNFVSATLAGSSVAFGWTAVPGRSYQVQYSAALAGSPWSDLGGPVTATNSVARSADKLGLDRQRFYRVATLPDTGPSPTNNGPQMFFPRSTIESSSIVTGSLTVHRSFVYPRAPQGP